MRRSNLLRGFVNFHWPVPTSVPRRLHDTFKSFGRVIACTSWALGPVESCVWNSGWAWSSIQKARAEWKDERERIFPRSRACAFTFCDAHTWTAFINCGFKLKYLRRHFWRLASASLGTYWKFFWSQASDFCSLINISEVFVNMLTFNTLSKSLALSCKRKYIFCLTLSNLHPLSLPNWNVKSNGLFSMSCFIIGVFSPRHLWTMNHPPLGPQ